MKLDMHTLAVGGDFGLSLAMIARWTPDACLNHLQVEDAHSEPPSGKFCRIYSKNKLTLADVRVT